MTTPNPAQQHIEVLRDLRTESVLCDIDPVVADALDYALAALEAVEGASKGIVRERGGSLAAIHYVIGMLPPDAAFPALGDNVLIIPADAVEVSRG